MNSPSSSSFEKSFPRRNETSIKLIGRLIEFLISYYCRKYRIPLPTNVQSSPILIGEDLFFAYTGQLLNEIAIYTYMCVGINSLLLIDVTSPPWRIAAKSYVTTDKQRAK